jgi:hypothetical protein
LTVSSIWIGEVGGRRAGPRRIFERVAGGEADLAHDRQGLAELGVGLAGEADDEVGRKRDVGPRPAHARDDVEIVADAVLAVHRRQDAVRAGLDRQVQIGGERRIVAMGGDQAVAHVVGVGGRVAQPQHAGNSAAAASSAARPLASPLASRPR